MNKKLYVISFIVFLSIVNVALAQFDSKNIDLIYNWQSTNTDVTDYIDIWGYEQNGREYAIIGSNWGTHFVDVTQDLIQPVEISSFKGKASNVIWRDFKTYSHYAYGVADGDTNSLQIFDLQFLPDSVVKVYDNDTISESAHNIFIENNRLYFCSNQKNKIKFNFALDVYSLQNPENPVHLASFPDSLFNDNAIHDVFVRDNMAFCSAGYGGLYIYDLNDLETPVLKALINVYPDQGYNHSSWLSEDGTKLVFADEVPSGLALKLFDVSNLSNIEFLDVFHSNDLATPHNPFFANGKIIVSYYLDGVQVFNYDNPFNVKREAFFDTHPDDTSYFDFSPFDGCWGVYPFFSSENIIASDSKNGLFVLQLNESLNSVATQEEDGNHLSVFPNPIYSSDLITISSDNKIDTYWIYNNKGQLLTYKESINRKNITLNTNILNSNAYIVTVKYSNNTFENFKLIK